MHGHFDDHSVANGYCPEQPAVTLAITTQSSTLSDQDLDPDYDNYYGSDSGMDIWESSNEEYEYNSSGSLDSYEDYQTLPETWISNML